VTLHGQTLVAGQDLLRQDRIRWACSIDWMMFFSRERCRTIWLRRVTWRRSACVAWSAIQTSGKKPLVKSCASTLSSIVSVLILACAIRRSCLGLAITTLPTSGAHYCSN